MNSSLLKKKRKRLFKLQLGFLAIVNKASMTSQVTIETPYNC
jgi:hypothetical protein